MRLAAFLILLVCFIPVFAQESVLRGTVKDADNKAIEMAQVVVKETNQTTLTDNKGNYSLRLSPGNYTIVFMMLGYTPQEKKVSLKKDETLKLHVLLPLEQKQLVEVEVTGKSKTQEVKEEAFNANAIETKQYANTTSDVNQLLNRSTGIKVREEGGLGSNFKFSINGLSGKQVKFFMDGIPMETFGSSLSLNNIPANLVQRIDVYKGVVPVNLGSDALGGAVNIVTNQKVKRFLDAGYSYGSFNTQRASLVGRFTDDKTGFTVNASAFYNSSDNNYIMKQVDVIEGNRFVKKDLPRFHDKYKSYMGQAEAGILNKNGQTLF